MIQTRYLILLLISSIALIGLLSLFPGIYFEGGSDIYSYHVIKGNFTSSPVSFFSSFGFYVFSSEFLAWFYRYCPTISWFDFAVFFNLVLSTFLLLVLWRIKQFNWLLLVFIGISWLDNILLPEITKYGFWIAFLSLQIFFSDPTNHKKRRFIVFLVFTYSFMIRAESSYLALICFVLYEVASKFQTSRESLLMTMKSIVPFTILGVFFYVVLNIPFSEQDQKYISFRPYQFTLWDFKQDPSTVSLQTGSDSVILMASENHFISDVSKINSSFFEKIHLHPKDKKLTAISAYFENGSFLKKKVAAELNSAKFYLLPLLLYAISVLIFLSTSQKKIKASALALVLLSAILLLSFFCVFMKLERHLVFPLIISAVLYMISSANGNYAIRFSRLALVVLASSILFTGIYNQYRFYRTYANVSDELCKDVNTRFPKSIIYIDLYTMVSLHERLFKKESFPYTRSVSFDNGIISYYPEWSQKMKRLGQPSSIPALAKKFNSHQEGIIFIFNKGREHLFESYFQLVYGEKVVFKEVVSPFSDNGKYPYSYYDISK